MSTEITTIQKIPNNELMAMAKHFFESGMFTDMKSASQAFVKIVAGQEIGIPPFAAMSGIHIIQGKPTIGAGLMAARVKGSGKYDYKVLQQDEKACSIDFYQGKEKIGNSTFTMDDAKKAQTKNIDRFPKNMLFARAMSNGVKWFCPDIFSGPVYTPEEMTTEDITPVSVTTTPAAPASPAPPEKKPISKANFDKYIVRVNNGETELLDKVAETFALTEEQADIIKTAKEIIAEQQTAGV